MRPERQLDEEAEIVVLERGPYLSFANCGLPYYVGNEIEEESKLLLAWPSIFRERFNIEVRTRNEVLAIDRVASTVSVRDLETGREYNEHYNALVLSPGAAPTPAEFDAGHLPNAINIPLQQIESGASLPLKDKNQVLLLHCHSGMRSAKATNCPQPEGKAVTIKNR